MDKCWKVIVYGSGGWKYNDKESVYLVSSKGSFLLDSVFYGSYMIEGQVILWGLFHKNFNSICDGRAFMTSSSQWLPLCI